MNGFVTRQSSCQNCKNNQEQVHQGHVLSWSESRFEYLVLQYIKLKLTGRHFSTMKCLKPLPLSGTALTLNKGEGYFVLLYL